MDLSDYPPPTPKPLATEPLPDQDPNWKTADEHEAFQTQELVKEFLNFHTLLPKSPIVVPGEDRFVEAVREYMAGEANPLTPEQEQLMRRIHNPWVDKPLFAGVDWGTPARKPSREYKFDALFQQSLPANLAHEVGNQMAAKSNPNLRTLGYTHEEWKRIREISDEVTADIVKAGGDIVGGMWPHFNEKELADLMKNGFEPPSLAGQREHEEWERKLQNSRERFANEFFGEPLEPPENGRD